MTISSAASAINVAALFADSGTITRNPRQRFLSIKTTFSAVSITPPGLRISRSTSSSPVKSWRMSANGGMSLPSSWAWSSVTQHRSRRDVIRSMALIWSCRRYLSAFNE